TLITFTNHHRDWPQRHSQEREHQIPANDWTDQALVVEPRDPLAFVDGGEGEHFSDIARRVATKCDFLRTIYFIVNEWRNFPPLFQLAALVFVCFNCEDP